MRRSIRTSLAALVLAGCLTPALAEEDGSDERAQQFAVYPVGRVEKVDGRKAIVVDEKYQDALLGLDGFSHVWVFWWFDRNDTPDKRAILQVHPRRNLLNPLTGVFATRSPVRPNLIALTLCRIDSVTDNVVRVESIDAFEDTPVLDLKPYIPGYDSTPAASVPDWI
jgi:tRNA-Thr(GGU) m(6)t(6)A37 methyltransferase TsaA